MKKTININLGGLVFQIDEDAYDRLNSYIEALKLKFTDLEEQKEIIQDIEYRFAELFNEGVNKSREVVSLEMVNNAIVTMGEPEEIEDELEQNEKTTYQKTTGSNLHKRLFRDPDDKIFAGVIAGLSKYIGIKDAIWLRIAMVLLVFAGVGFPIIGYFILWFLLPEAQTASEKLQMNGEAINLDNIEEQVKKNINSDEIRRTSVRAANKLGEMAPLILKVIAIGLIIFFSFNLLGLVVTLLGGGLIFSLVQPEFVDLILDNPSTYYIGLVSLFLLLSVPLIVAIGSSIKLLTRKKINWAMSITTILLLIILSLIGVGYSVYNSFSNFRQDAEQTNFVALENPTVDELEIIFPYSELKEDLNLSFQFGRNHKGNNIEMEGFEVNKAKKLIKINLVEVDIKKLENDTIFKLSKTIYSKGKTIEDAEEKLEHITNAFDFANEKTIVIPKEMILENETKWRNQTLKYDLYVPIGKRIYFGDNAKKVIDDVDFNGDYSRKNLANNTWEMTKTGLKCISCKTSEE